MAPVGVTVTAPAENAQRLSAADAIATFALYTVSSVRWGETHPRRQGLTIALRHDRRVLTTFRRASWVARTAVPERLAYQPTRARLF